MKSNKTISGFSKWTKQQKIRWLKDELNLSDNVESLLLKFELDDLDLQSIISELSENCLSNYHLPFTVAPNFKVNGNLKVFPLVIEESSVVAALAKAAGYWAKRGGFRTEILGAEKKGQVHFQWAGNPEKIKHAFPEIKQFLVNEAHPITQKMEKRGGGVLNIELNYLPGILPNYYQLDVSFDTRDAMGANFINSCLEQFGQSLQAFFQRKPDFTGAEKEVEIIMCILSNYVPNSRVKVWVECPVADLMDNMEEARAFADKLVRAVHISRNDVSRAVTHNKGIFNGMDALAIATGNDFRALEAGGHAYAARNGKYVGLSEAEIRGEQFIFSMEVAMVVGVVGGVTTLHPLAKLAMQILENPSAVELMSYIAVAGLASNWSAVNALVTSGIQKGHMKMHLSNILHAFKLTNEQKQAVRDYFQDKAVSQSAVEEFLKGNAK
ncbi:hydroxymethylglutaryl-CoA reductase [Sunxiuqinia sp. A32]|uniref:hydroxymethylglutaryl-CoA reductase n=1 Tax=Sunxiuqinia sp. A32 TaxID=3461496 RepID=UPI0040464378